MATSFDPCIEKLDNVSKTYVCGQIILPINDTDGKGNHIVAPFVKMCLCDGTTGEEIVTVGNKSSKNFNNENEMAITSFQWGSDNGLGCTVEIADYGGNSFEEFSKHVMTPSNAADDQPKYTMNVRWGWIITDCEGNETIRSSYTHTLFVLSIQLKFDSIYKYVISGTDMFGASLITSKIEEVYGSDNNPMKLKDAIKKLIKETAPKSNKIFFLKRKGKKFEKFEFGVDKNSEPKGVWHGDNKIITGTIYNWIDSFETEDEKGVKIVADGTNGLLTENGSTKGLGADRFGQHTTSCNDACSPTIVVLSDPYEKKEGCADNNIGTYIVNGGECSSVISFHPQVEAVYAPMSQVGGNIDAKAGATAYKQNPDPNSKTNWGTSTYHTVTEVAYRNELGDAAGKTIENSKKHYIINNVYKPISAELVIQGDPGLDNFLTTKCATLSLIVLNPFHLALGEYSDCPEWIRGTFLNDVGCNSVLSSKEWFIDGVSHEISSGSYTTTLRIRLIMPQNQGL